jgi:hypothetical protein
MRMPFGDYRGVELAEIPDAYLLWVLDHVSPLDPDLKELIRRRLGRLDGGAGRMVDGERAAEAFLSVLTGVYREMAVRFHPDHGGSHEAMTALNAMYGRLVERLGQVLRDLSGR